MSVVRITRVFRSETIEITQGSSRAKAICSDEDADDDSYIRFEGSVGYTLNFDTVNLRFDKIDHNCESTGGLKLKLWAVSDYEGGGGWNGFVLGKYKLNALDSTHCYLDRNLTAPRTSPPPGTYTIIMALYAREDEEFIKQDYRVFDDRIDIYSHAKLEGSWYYCDGDSVSLYARRISHNFFYSTGPLKLMLWACSKSDFSSGYKMGEVELESLEDGKSYIEVIRKVPLTRPPTGSYFIFMQLLSYESDWFPRDKEMLKDKASF